MSNKKYHWVIIKEASAHWQRHYIGYETEAEAIGCEGWTINPQGSCHRRKRSGL